MPEDRQEEELQGLIGNSRYIPFLHRLQESYFSMAIKWCVNFIIAVFQTFNVPAFVLLLIFFFEQFMQKVIDPTYSFPYNFEMIASGFAGWFLIQLLWAKTTRNIVSPTVFPIWFMNSKGVLKNEFFSAELSRKYSADLEQFVRYQADEYIKEQLRDKDLHIDRLINAIEQLRQLSMFPNESFESMRRVVENLVDVVIDPNKSRHQFEVIMDRILVEITTMKSIQPIIRQGSIMLLNSSKELRIIGQYNMPNSVVRNRVVSLGEKFAGKVALEGEIVWIQDVNTPEAEQEYQFEPDPNRRYAGIMGFPIRESGLDEYKPVGVIVLHFVKGYHLEEEQKVAVAKVLEVYAQVILSSLKLQNYHRNLKKKYGIMRTQEEVSVTFDPGGDTV
ncbi:GAF domain-containing protein [Paenibacillus sp. MY03]|uniref:GAF domain-containing protein n=1 Tax=Paenibacillus sp. MY03 TaxID=302980 RepID=UPI000B3CE096|nr:GAF domain-containing protein [Paenibacillus sp. MY03]OUS74805.1 GAF domain-containing protein [Paenibacillus sp. MY03]